MDREQEVIHKQMEETRSDLTDKLAALESQVGGTVQAATNAVEITTEAVTGTVETVKETVESVTEKLHDTVTDVTDSVQQCVEGAREAVEETVKSVTEAFNLSLQCERHPWAVFGGSVGVGFLGGWLLGGSSSSARAAGRWQSVPTPNYPRPTEFKSETANVQPAQAEGSQTTKQPSGSVLGGEVGGWLKEQLGGLKGLAIGATMSLVRDLVGQALPESLKERVTDEVDKLTKSLGGEPIKGSILPQNNQEELEPGKDKGQEQQRQTDPRDMGRSETTGGRAGKPAMAGNQR
jgi:hypothetical protein